MRIVLDTNIFIAALITRGTPPDQLYSAWLRGTFSLVTSTAQLHEIEAVFARPRLKPLIDPGQAAAVLDNIDTRALVFDDLPVVELSPDPDDNAILATALAGSADLVVSGDKKHMLILDTVNGIPIISPRAALDRLSRR